MRNLLARLTGRGLCPPRMLPTLRRTRAVGLGWVIGGTAGFLSLILLGAWMDLDGEERRLQQRLDERAVWLGGFLDGRAEGRLALRAQLDSAYLQGLADGAGRGCTAPQSGPQSAPQVQAQPQRLMVRP